MNDDLNRRNQPSWLAIIQDEGRSSVLLFWKVWWRSFAVEVLLLIFLLMKGFGELPTDWINLVGVLGFFLLLAVIIAVLFALCIVGWRLLGVKVFIPPIGVLIGAILGALIAALMGFAVLSFLVGDRGAPDHGGGHAVVLGLLVLIKFFALAGAMLGGLGGVLLVGFLVRRMRRSNRPAGS